MTAELPTDRRTVPFSHYLNLPVFHPAFVARLAAARRGGANSADTARPSASP
jgi:hypothetical protein